MLGTINDAYQTVKNGLEVEVALATAGQKEKLADAKLALAELKEYIADLKDENRSLREKQNVKENVVYDEDGKAWIGDEPYCGGCIGAKQSTVRLKHYRNNLYECPSCKTRYGNFKEPQRPAPVGK
jgi:hypothetical protein